MRSNAAFRSVAACIAAWVIPFLVVPAHANVVLKTWTSATRYDYSVIHMPDLDQRRDALGGDGSMFCVPTSQMNLMGYCANHGFPMVFPGPRSWQSQANYELGDFSIDLMGALMDTDPADGTNNGGWEQGAEEFLILGGKDQLSITHYTGTETFNPTAAGLAKTAINGSIISFGYRRYDIVDEQGDFPVLMGTGAHAITMVRAHAGPDGQTVTAADPADTSDSLLLQSPFSLREFECTSTWVVVGAGGTPRYVTSLNHDPDSGKLRVIATMMSVRPKNGFSFKNTLGVSQLVLQTPIAFAGSGQPAVTVVNWPTAASLFDAAVHPDGGSVIAIEKLPNGMGGLKEWDPLTGEATSVAPTLDLRKLAVGRKRQVYVADVAGKVYCLDPDNGYAITAATSNNPPVTAMAYDDFTDQLVILSVPQRRIARYNAGLGGAPANIVIPEWVPLAGDGSVMPDPWGEQTWFTSDGSDTVFGIAVNGESTSVESITDAAIVDPKGICFDDLGHLFVSCGGPSRQVKEFEQVRGEWSLRAGSPFTGLACGEVFSISRSRTNYDAATMSGPGWQNLLPEETLQGIEHARCDADFDGSGIVDGADLGMLLGMWGTNETLADVNQDGTIDGADLGAMLGAWGECP